MPQDNSTLSLTDYVVTIDADTGVNSAGDRFAVRSGGVELLSARETRHVWLGGNASISKDGGAVELKAADTTAAQAFDFQVAGTSRFTLGKTAPVALSKVVIEVIDYPNLPEHPTEAGQMVIERRYVNSTWQYWLCVGAVDSNYNTNNGLRWFKKSHTNLP